MSRYNNINLNIKPNTIVNNRINNTVINSTSENDNIYNLLRNGESIKSVYIENNNIYDLQNKKNNNYMYKKYHNDDIITSDLLNTDILINDDPLYKNKYIQISTYDIYRLVNDSMNKKFYVINMNNNNIIISEDLNDPKFYNIIRGGLVHFDILVSNRYIYLHNGNGIIAYSINDNSTFELSIISTYRSDVTSNYDSKLFCIGNNLYGILMKRRADDVFLLSLNEINLDFSINQYQKDVVLTELFSDYKRRNTNKSIDLNKVIIIINSYNERVGRSKRYYKDYIAYINNEYIKYRYKDGAIYSKENLSTGTDNVKFMYSNEYNRIIIYKSKNITIVNDLNYLNDSDRSVYFDGIFLGSDSKSIIPLGVYDNKLYTIYKSMGDNGVINEMYIGYYNISEGNRSFIRIKEIKNMNIDVYPSKSNELILYDNNEDINSYNFYRFNIKAIKDESSYSITNIIDDYNDIIGRYVDYE